MEQQAIEILDAHRTMAIATVRSDGWPQNTAVGYANEGLLVYFLVSRSSQKFANIAKDDRVALAIYREPADLREVKALFAGAKASEVTDPKQREHAWELLMKRHPNLAEFELPSEADAAMMRAVCMHVSILDFSKGFGHTDELTIGSAGVATMEPARTDDWGYSPRNVRGIDS
jgi:nitroimidazol reductase NimA-like FMN-containing flavoprotein (pyridoxamine 5'-phosphate oxidase superfamily)